MHRERFIHRGRPPRQGKSYDEWLGGKPPSNRDKLRVAIDAALAEQTAAATARFNALSARLKEQQTKLAQNALLQKQIVAYAKTRDTYVAYRKAGYSKKFLAEHEEEIMLHKAAKKAFDDLGVKKLPTMKSLKAEYAVLLAEKKSTYAAYQQARAEMRELLTVKANIDRLLEVAGQPVALDKQAEQREQ